MTTHVGACRALSGRPPLPAVFMHDIGNRYSRVVFGNRAGVKMSVAR